jgi:dCMP deaminase
MKKVLIAYVPVLHEGYRALFARHSDAEALFLFGEDVIAEYKHLLKDIRKLHPELTQKAIASWNLFPRIELLTQESIKALQAQKDVAIIFSDDDVTRELMEKYFPEHQKEADTIFLRWDKKTAIEPMQVSPDVRISHDAFDRDIIAATKEEAQKSPDWWRRIGAFAVRDGKILFTAHNTYLPAEQTAYDEGDPRSNFSSGVHLESSLAFHAEANLVAQAAKTGTSLEGADVYSETFPCPPCAKQLAASGIKRLFYRTGYKVLDGERILKSFGVEIVFVE